MFDNIERTAVFIRDCIRDIPERHKANFDRVGQLDEEMQDLAHLMEFADLNASEGYKAYKEMQRNRRERRKLKDENALLEPLANTVKKFKQQLSELDKVIGDIRKEQNFQATRSYKCRVRKDLQIKIDENNKKYKEGIK